jgi:hypothetical protein
VGAAVVACTNWLTAQLRMPTSGPVAEMPYLVIGLLADRWKDMTWYMIVQLRRGNLLALPAEMRLPMVLRLWRRTSWVTRAATLAIILVLAGGLYLYVSLYAVTRVPEGTAIALHISGAADVTKAGSNAPVALTDGTSLHAGDRVTTGRASEALLRLADGSQMRVYPYSEVYIQDLSGNATSGTRVDLQVMSGNVFTKVRKLVNRNSSFTVESPVLTLGVRGTTFSLGVDEGRGLGKVAVGEGTVEIQRQSKVIDADTGQMHMMAETQAVEEHQALEAQRNRSAAKLEFLQPEDVARLDLAKSSIEQDNKTMYVSAVKSNTVQGLIFGLIILYLAFLIYLKPEPPGYLPEILAKRAQEFEAIHKATPHDPSRSAALAQMYLRAGDEDKAQDELRSILEHDPKSEYGQWAARMRTQLSRGGPRR